MKTEQFLEHHGIGGNPFSEEDAQTDTVFKRRCLVKIHHPAWNKFFGSPADPSTALVFGEKGSGKTALRLQAVSELDAYNHAHPEERVFVICYDDFNPYLDHFKAALKARDTIQALSKWRLQDHMDAILAQGVTQLVDAAPQQRRWICRLSVSISAAICSCWRRCTTSRPASQSSVAGAGSAVAPASAPCGRAGIFRLASARP